MNQCAECKKKVAVALTCKCGKVTCLGHKWPHHQCSFDFRAEHLEKLKHANPVIVAEKILKI